FAALSCPETPPPGTSPPPLHDALPISMDPHAPRAGDLSGISNASLQGVLRRRAEFDNAEDLFRRLRAAPTFATWTERSLWAYVRSEEHTSELQSRENLVCRLLLEKKKK